MSAGVKVKKQPRSNQPLPQVKRPDFLAPSIEEPIEEQLTSGIQDPLAAQSPASSGNEPSGTDSADNPPGADDHLDAPVSQSDTGDLDDDTKGSNQRILDKTQGSADDNPLIKDFQLALEHDILNTDPTSTTRLKAWNDPDQSQE